MLNANYIKHLKILGKLCYLYDSAASSESALKDLRATTIDQAATGLAADLPASDLISRIQPQYEQAIESGPTALQALAISTAGKYLQDEYFTSTLTTAPANGTVAAIIAAWETDAGAGLDNKSFTTESSSGLINFFDVLKGSETTFQGSGSPSYADGTYVVSAVV